MIKNFALWVALANFALHIASAPWTFEEPGDHRLHPYGVDPDTIDVGGPETPRIIGVNGHSLKSYIAEPELCAGRVQGYAGVMKRHKDAVHGLLF